MSFSRVASEPFVRVRQLGYDEWLYPVGAFGFWLILHSENDLNYFIFYCKCNFNNELINFYGVHSTKFNTCVFVYEIYLLNIKFGLFSVIFFRIMEFDATQAIVFSDDESDTDVEMEKKPVSQEFGEIHVVKMHSMAFNLKLS